MKLFSLAFLPLLTVSAIPTLRGIPQPVILADTNRDGKVDDDDQKGRTEWTEKSGAIFLPNIGDSTKRCPEYKSIERTSDYYKEMNRCNDAMDDELIELAYLAPMKTNPLNAPDGAWANIYATPDEAASRVRVFYQEHDNWEYVKPDFKFNEEMLRQGITLGLDGRETVRSADGWDGQVTVHFDVFLEDHAQAGSDKVVLKIAPIILQHSLQDLQEVLSPATSIFSGIYGRRLSYFTEQLNNAFKAIGFSKVLTPIQTQWVQDLGLPAYASMPGPEGPVSIRLFIVSPNTEERLAVPIYDQIRGKGVGIIHPTPDERKLERLVTVADGGFDPRRGNLSEDTEHEFQPSGDLMRLLNAQRLQPLLLLNSGWLEVGHLDEFLQFIPSEKTDTGFTVTIADAKAGRKVLQDLDDSGEGDQHAMTYDRAAFEKNPDGYGRGPEVRTIKEVLDDDGLKKVNEWAQEQLDANLKLLLDEIPLKEDDVVRIPTVFREDSYHLLITMHPNPLNGIVVGDNFLSADPRGPTVDGEDKLKTAVTEAYGDAGMKVAYVDTLEILHYYGGGLHCATNTWRTPAAKWWSSR
ncbi:Uu.00g040030.m01.CDS01 [Anthostomella pinea]|uniref:Uu.00g040030.m01.CDS01 n=1 Tax=Anthostomella pinea TaxID=933095 RepID=A0AAI8YDW0_9PEZI|nr:Uu.00g040030.m01.CDS01 [Anthostomella pinea]